MRPPSNATPRFAALVLAMAALAACAGGAGPSSAGHGTVGSCAAPGAPPPPGQCPLVCRAELPLDTSFGSPAVTVWVNDTPTSMVLDTGSATTALTPQAASRLGLAANASLSSKTWGVGGVQITHPLQPVSLAFGTIRLPHATIEAVSAELHTYNLPRDGLLGADILSNYELDLDVLHARARIYEGRACGGAPPGWSGVYDSVAFIPAFRGFHQIAIPVALNGRPMMALLDTGADRSLVDTDAALASGADPRALSQDIGAVMSGAGSEHPRGAVHRFATLQIGSEIMTNLDAAVTRLPFRQPAMLLGGDFLRANRVWISYGMGKVFFAPYALR